MDIRKRKVLKVKMLPTRIVMSEATLKLKEIF